MKFAGQSISGRRQISAVVGVFKLAPIRLLLALSLALSTACGDRAGEGATAEEATEITNRYFAEDPRVYLGRFTMSLDKAAAL